MNDAKIVALYWKRDEKAIFETSKRYGRYCHCIAWNILQDNMDAQECVNDTYLDAWNAMPPHKPSALSTFLGKITRRIAIDRWRQKNTLKRGADTVQLALDELETCVSGSSDVESEFLQRQRIKAIHDFLSELPDTDRRVFLQRYWYLESIDQIAARFGFSGSKTASILHRIRGKLRSYLEKEGCL